MSHIEQDCVDLYRRQCKPRKQTSRERERDEYILTKPLTDAMDTISLAQASPGQPSPSSKRHVRPQCQGSPPFSSVTRSTSHRYLSPLTYLSESLETDSYLSTRWRQSRGQSRISCSRWSGYEKPFSTPLEFTPSKQVGDSQLTSG